MAPTRHVPALILLAGMMAGGLLWGLVSGGTLATGQADPVRWAFAQGATMAVLVSLAHRAFRAWKVPLLAFGLSGAIVATFLLCGLAGQYWPWASAFWLALICILVMAVANGLWAVRVAGWPRWAGLASAAALLALVPIRARHEAPPATAEAARPRLAVMTALPLFWAEGGDPAALLGAGQAPALRALARHYRLIPLDHLDPAVLSAQPMLLLAQPRLLAPAELVALDAWVRGGGRAVMLADPLLRWPGVLPPGDRRRAPVTSLLDPLLAHWGLRLEPVMPGREGIERRFLADGRLLTLAAASRFGGDAPGCRFVEQGLMALCHIGQGQVRLIADADLIDDRLWLADPARPIARESQAADTMALLADWLAAPLGGNGKDAGRPLNWVRDEAALMRATRWALLACLIWVGMGLGGLLFREKMGKGEKSGKTAVKKRGKPSGRPDG